MNNFTEEPMPYRIAKRPRDKRGYPIPYIVTVDDNGTPHFTVNDEEKVMRTRVWKLCAICGYQMKGSVWVVGGVLSAFADHGAYIDTPVHRGCGEYALKVCPYLAVPSFTNIPTENIIKRVVSESKTMHIDPTMDEEKPDVFVFAKTSRMKWIKPEHTLTVLGVPTKPFLSIEYWKDGVRLEETEGRKITLESKYKDEINTDNMEVI